MKGKLFLILIVLLAAAGGYFYFTGVINFQPPKIVFEKKPQYIGSDTTLKFKIIDDKPGIKAVQVFLIQNKNIKILEDLEFPTGLKEKEYSLKIDARKYGLTEGKAKISIVAQDSSLLKNTKNITYEVKVDLTPPTLSILSSPAGIMNGGTGFVFYRTSSDVVKTGVKVGNLEFKCFNGIVENKNIYGCAFPYPYYWNRKKSIVVFAVDRAGNKTSHALRYYFKRKKYRRSVINLSDEFIETKVRPLSDREISDPAELFKYVNVEVRKKNEDLIHKITSNVSIKQPLFHSNFLQLKNSKMLGGFADYRKYRYKGKIIKGADAYHKGMDFASIKNATVQAAEDGKVVYTGFIGIYGNSIIIEHGMGVFTIYSHLAEIHVNKGDEVVRGTEIGITDTTGLAVGDHLHFGVLVQGLEVHPIEWLDRHWLKTRFLDEYKRIKTLYGGQ
ncbi:M23 family metallopeptidase [Persephonella atlantica]|uniref:M23 family metallopeptidase n=1 Tax=Persephonella atlantica TaxID=2699429 RepID=A0ABS1GI91_9AQUI|nr:M23 family metallopeptidase [Persephonella atlantica]MBK3332623.1 M23 family metallopeptidase [Persephonella atlantica]